MSVWREVQETLYRRWRDQWVVAPGGQQLTPYYFANEKFDAPAAPWAGVRVIRFPGAPGTMGSPGNRKMDRRGAIFIDLREPPLNGVGDLSDLAERAAAIFENCRLLANHDIRFGPVEPGQEALVQDGRWWGVSVEGRFDYEDIR